MVEMTRSVQVACLTPDFNTFLFAPIGEDGNGMLLSVLSALARQEIDPWQEAATLARLPKATATERLASLITTPCGALLTHPEPYTIAARLVAFLPNPPRTIIQAHDTTTGRGSSNDRAVTIRLVGAAILMWLALSIAFDLSSHQNVPATQDHTGGASTACLKKPSPAVSR